MAASALMNVMIGAARKAGRGLTRDFGEVEQLQVSVKGPGNFVTAADHRSEETLFRELSRARPGYGFLMEERGAVDGPRQDASLDRRSARRHHQLPARHPALLHRHRAGARRRDRLRAWSTIRSSTSSTRPRRARAPSSTAGACAWRPASRSPTASSPSASRTAAAATTPAS